MYRLKSHIWPARTLCRLEETFRNFVKYVRGRGGEAPGGAPGGRCPKCRTVAHRLHSGAHFGRWFLFTFVNSSAKKQENEVPKSFHKWKSRKNAELSRTVAIRQKRALRESRGEAPHVRKIRHFRGSRRETRKAGKTLAFSKRKMEKLYLSSREAS